MQRNPLQCSATSCSATPYSAAPPDAAHYNFPSGRSLLGYRPVTQLTANADAVDAALALSAHNT